MVDSSRPSAPLPSSGPRPDGAGPLGALPDGATAVAPDDARVADAAVARAQRWLRTSRGARPAEVGRREAAATSSLAALLHDPSGVAFTMGFVDEVARPEDDRVAAKALRRLVSPAGGGAPGRAFMAPSTRRCSARAPSLRGSHRRSPCPSHDCGCGSWWATWSSTPTETTCSAA